MNPLAATGAIEALATHQPLGLRYAPGGARPADLLRDPMVLKLIGAGVLYVWRKEDETARLIAMALAAWAGWDYLHRPRTTHQATIDPVTGQIKPSTVVQAPILAPGGAWPLWRPTPTPGQPGAHRAAAAEEEGLRQAEKRARYEEAGARVALGGEPRTWGWEWPDGRFEPDPWLATASVIGVVR